MHMVKRWYCTVSSTEYERCSQGGGSNGNAGAMPKSGRCPKCKGPAYEKEGVYAVFRYKEDGRYRLTESLGHRLTEAAAAKLAFTIDKTGTRLCVRFVGK